MPSSGAKQSHERPINGSSGEDLDGDGRYQMPKLLSVAPYYVICILVLTAAIGVLLLTAPELLQLPEVVLGLGLAPIAVSLALTCPVLLCTLFMIISYFRIHEAFPVLYPLHLPLALAILSLMSAFIHMVGGQVRFTWRPPLKFLIVLFVFVVVSCITSTDQYTSRTTLGDLVKIFLMTFVIAWLFRKPTHFQFITRVVIIAGATIALVAIDNYVTGFDLIGGRVRIGSALNSSIGDPNDLCLVLLFAWSFCLAVIVIRPSPVDCILGLIATPALLWAMIATQSRGGLIGVLAVVAIIGSQKWKSKPVMVLTCLALCAAIFIAMADNRGSSFGEDSAFDDSSQNRLNAWIAAIKMGISRPIWGVGLNTFRENLWSYKTDMWADYHDMVAHSTWLTVFAEIGVPGFVVFIMMVGSTWRACRHNLSALECLNNGKALKVVALGLMGGVGGFCASGTFLSQAFTWPIYIFVGLTVSLSNYLDGLTDAPAKPPTLPERIGAGSTASAVGS
jgi:putative inorganic carbon (hco3(-)) transporter